MVSSIDLESSEEWMIYWSLIHILTFILVFFTVLGAINRDKYLCPVSRLERSIKGPMRRRDILGCVIHDYYSQSSVQFLVMDRIIAPYRGSVEKYL